MQATIKSCNCWVILVPFRGDTLCCCCGSCFMNHIPTAHIHTLVLLLIQSYITSLHIQTAVILYVCLQQTFSLLQPGFQSDAPPFQESSPSPTVWRLRFSLYTCTVFSWELAIRIPTPLNSIKVIFFFPFCQKSCRDRLTKLLIYMNESAIPQDCINPQNHVESY